MSFAPGDKVSYNGHDATVLHVIPPSFQRPAECEIEFADKNLIPPLMRVPASTLLFLGPTELDEYDNQELLSSGINLLKPLSGHTYKLGKPNPDVICPQCETPWHQTPHNGGTWYDCLKCGKKKEEIVNDKN